jgi:hypothetical protein
MRFHIDQPPWSRDRLLVRRRFVQRDLHKCGWPTHLPPAARQPARSQALEIPNHQALCDSILLFPLLNSRRSAC